MIDASVRALATMLGGSGQGTATPDMSLADAVQLLLAVAGGAMAIVSVLVAVWAFTSIARDRRIRRLGERVAQIELECRRVASDAEISARLSTASMDRMIAAVDLAVGVAAEPDSPELSKALAAVVQEMRRTRALAALQTGDPDLVASARRTLGVEQSRHADATTLDRIQEDIILSQRSVA